jgi:hypothetical protein
MAAISPQRCAKIDAQLRGNDRCSVPVLPLSFLDDRTRICLKRLSPD